MQCVLRYQDEQQLQQLHACMQLDGDDDDDDEKKLEARDVLVHVRTSATRHNWREDDVQSIAERSVRGLDGWLMAGWTTERRSTLQPGSLIPSNKWIT